MIRKLVCLTLGARGFRCVEADTGEAAIARALEAPTPSVVLLDRILPDTSGERLLARLRADPRTRSIPVVGLSGLPPDPGAEGGLDAYLEKPFRLEELAALVDRLVRGRSPAG